MTLKNNTTIPLYQQLSEILKEKIGAGIYSAGSKIPSEEDLRQMYSISRVTVRKAIDLLIEEGTLVRRHGLGTFVAAPVFIESPNARGSFAISCLQRGVVPSTKIISKGIIQATEEIAAALEIENGAPVYEIHRLRLANSVASIYEIDFLCAKKHGYLEEIDLEDASLLEIIQKSTGQIFDGVEDMIDIAYAGEQIAGYLECKAGTPLLSIYQKMYAGDGKIMYINRQYIRSDRYKYVCSTVRRT